MAEAHSAVPAGYLLPRDTLLVRGPDRKSWLDGLLTCAVAEVAPGVARYGLLLTKQGKIVSDVFLADSGTELFVGVAPDQGAAVQSLLDRYLVMEDAEIAAADGAPAWLIGRADSESALARGTLTLRDLVSSLSVVRAAPPGVKTAEELASLLAEHGLGRFGVDFSERDNPHEASLDRVAVSWTKGCYLGQEVVCMQDMRGKVKRRLVALAADRELAAATTSAPTLEVFGSGDTPVGQVTSLHAGPSEVYLLASLASSVLEAPEPLSVLGKPVRVIAGPGL